MTNPRNTSTRTTLEKLTRRTVNEAADELIAFLEKLPEHGTPLPKGIITVDCLTDRDTTREKIKNLRDAIRRYFAED